MGVYAWMTRRAFLGDACRVAAVFALPAIPGTALAAEENEAEINPVEDLMREHGVLRRVLLIYGEVIQLIDGKKEVPPGVVADSAGIVRRFVEDYHEKLEEEELFPRFEEAGQYTDLVRVLYTQHQAGRRLTDLILKSTASGMPATAGARRELRPVLHQFIRMYRPHADREDTVLFPAFRSIVSAELFDQLGERFEGKEQKLFGKEGFEKMVKTVGEIEKRLGIFELSQFTPQV